MSHIRTRKASDESRESKGDARAKQGIAKRRSPVADADDERQQRDQRKQVFERPILIVREIAEGHALNGRIPCRGEHDDIVECGRQRALPDRVRQEAYRDEDARER